MWWLQGLWWRLTGRLTDNENGLQINYYTYSGLKCQLTRGSQEIPTTTNIDIVTLCALERPELVSIHSQLSLSPCATSVMWRLLDLGHSLLSFFFFIVLCLHCLHRSNRLVGLACQAAFHLTCFDFFQQQYFNSGYILTERSWGGVCVGLCGREKDRFRRHEQQEMFVLQIFRCLTPPYNNKLSLVMCLGYQKDASDVKSFWADLVWRVLSEDNRSGIAAEGWKLHVAESQFCHLVLAWWQTAKSRRNLFFSAFTKYNCVLLRPNRADWQTQSDACK